MPNYKDKSGHNRCGDQLVQASLVVLNPGIRGVVGWQERDGETVRLNALYILRHQISTKFIHRVNSVRQVKIPLFTLSR